MLITELPTSPPPLISALAAGVAQYLLAPRGRPGRARVAAGWALTAASVALLGSALIEFRRRRTTISPLTPGQASTLVTTGPNRLTRNPMYVGMAGLLTAHAVMRGGWTTPVPVAGFVVLIDRLQIQPEEAALRELFGAEYTTYCDSVPRWLALPRWADRANRLSGRLMTSASAGRSAAWAAWGHDPPTVEEGRTPADE